MTLIDRYIVARFLWNFAVLFVLLFVFAVSIDLILHLDDFVDVTKTMAGTDAGIVRRALVMVMLIVDYQGPRVFQFYSYLHGLVAIGAMGFTLAQMHRHRELVAVMASGVSLLRVAVPFVVVVFGLSLIQLINQEAILPRMAPLLLRDQSQIGEHGVAQFEVPFTPDSIGNLLQSPSFDPPTQTLVSPTFLERNDRGVTVRRVSAAKAVWEPASNAWRLTEARVIALRDDDRGDAAAAAPAQNIELYSTSITPQVLIVRHHGQFASMLSMEQIRAMLAMPGITDVASLKRHLYSRFAGVLIDLLVLLISLPAFLLREPSNLLIQSVSCAVMSIPAIIGAAIGMMMQLPGIPPAVGVFLPALVLIPVAMARLTTIKT
jgi:lipopolysaccharide export LptBFGC system permease protein LptF